MCAKVEGLFDGGVIRVISNERCVYYDGPAGRGVGVARRAVGVFDKRWHCIILDKTWWYEL